MKKKISILLCLICMFTLLFGSSALADEYDELEVTVDGQQMFITSDYPSEYIPSGFTETRVTYQGKTFFGGLDDATQTVSLFYLRSDSDESLNGFYKLNSDDTFTKYTSVSIAGNSFVPGSLGDDVTIPSGYVEKQFAVENTMLTAYQKEDASGDEAAFYLLYGSVNGGADGWYSYDSTGGTLQRYMDSGSAATIAEQETQISDLESQLKEINTKYNKNIGRSKKLFVLMAVLTLFFLFLMINAMIKRAHTRLDLEERILDLKRNGGRETQNFSKREAKRNAKQDAKAAKRLKRDEDDLDDEEFDVRPAGKSRGSRAERTRGEESYARRDADYDRAEDSDREPRSARRNDRYDETRTMEGDPRKKRRKEKDLSELEMGLTEVSDEFMRGEKAGKQTPNTTGRPQKGVTEDMSSALKGDDDDFDFDILDLDD